MKASSTLSHETVRAWNAQLLFQEYIEPVEYDRIGSTLYHELLYLLRRKLHHSGTAIELDPTTYLHMTDRTHPRERRDRSAYP